MSVCVLDFTDLCLHKENCTVSVSGLYPNRGNVEECSTPSQRAELVSVKQGKKDSQERDCHLRELGL